jgi:hypothetical protein
LVGRFASEHALIVGQMLAHIDFLDESIDRLSEEITRRIEPFAAQRDLLMTIPGVKQRVAEVLIAEIGVQMSVFATPKHLTWSLTSRVFLALVVLSLGRRVAGVPGQRRWIRLTFAGWVPHDGCPSGAASV